MTEEVVLDTEAESQPIADKTAEEKTLPVSRVEELVKKAKLKGRDSMQAELDALKAENATLKSNAGSMGGMNVPTIDVNAIKQDLMNDFRKQMQDANEKRAQEELESQAKKIAENYHAKMAGGKQSYEDFDEVMSDFNPAAFPNLVYLTAQVDNTPDVMYELNKNPSKLATLTILSERDPQAALNMINKISASIKANAQAKAEEKNVAPPLSRLSSSTTGQDNGKPQTTRDFKAMFRG